MVDIPLKEALLETIDSLKKRKARPDIERICHMLRRKRGISSEDTKEALEKLVDAAVVVKVEYKGNISYRNVAKWKKWGSRYCLNPFTTSSRVFAAVKAIAEMQVRDGLAKEIFDPEVGNHDTDETDLAGATLVEIACWLRDVHPDLDLTRPPIDIMVEREVDVGHLDRLQDGRLVAWIAPQPKSPEHLSVKPKPPPKVKKSKGVGGLRSPTSSTSSEQIAAAITLEDQLSLLKAEQIKQDPDQPIDLSPTGHSKRKGTKRRKIKKTLGPDFESYGTVKKARRSSHEASSSRPVTPTASMLPVKEEEDEEQGKAGGRGEQLLLCDYCLQTASCNRKGTQEDLLICTDCQAKAHPSCMDYSSDLARRARRSPWQCIDCKTCCLCEDAGDPDAMLFCDACDKGYHMSCHSPVIEDKPTDCGPGGVLTPRQSPVQFTDRPQSSNSSMNGSVKVSKQKSWVVDVPDAADWSIDEVAQYFSDIGFVDQSETFRDQEIDGRSLLLLKRSDVLTGLCFKLGPALKMYSHVQQLQLRGQQGQQ